MNVTGPSVATSLYADEVAIYYSSGSIVTIERRLQGAISLLSGWARNSGLTFFTNKTTCLHFTRLSSLYPDPCVPPRNRVLPFVATLMFLGLVLDRKLSWEPYIRYLRVECELSLNILKNLSGRSWGGDGTVMLRLCLSHMRSKIDWQRRVWLHQEVQTVCSRPCSEYWTSSCHWLLSHQPSG